MPVFASPELLAFLSRFDITPHAIELYVCAVTHRSYLNEHLDAEIEDNERLEFFGDAVLDFLAARWLYFRLPNEPEGVLTRLRAGIVGNEYLATYAAELGIGALLRLGKGEEAHGGRTRKRNLSGAFEALLGAIYQDQGEAAAARLAEAWFVRRYEAIMSAESSKDSKSRLQEWSQTTLRLIPSYQVVQMAGQEHSPTFTVAVAIGDNIYGEGTGRSKRDAEQAAASAALEYIAAQKGSEG
ncbi:MAG: ribonuclease III [Anaerolineae bacterium]